jgi:T4-like virus Myoviridae tail sheath stabiliser
MFGNEFYHETIRRYVIVFGTMFNDMVVWRRDNAGNIVKRIKVPIAYGPRAKFLSRIQQDPNLTKPDAISLPRMSFQITGYNYDASRKLSTANQIKTPADSDRKNSSVYNPVPWNIDFDLSIYVLNAEDGTMLIEQILPYFTPEWTNTIKLVDDLDLRMDVPVVLNTITTEDTYEDAYENRRTIIHTLNFTMKGYVFGPVKDKNIINTATTRAFVIDGFASDLAAEANVIGSNATLANTLYFTTTSVRPGLDANGNPTTNAQVSIAANNIAANDNWDFIITTNTNPDFPVDDPTNDPDI